MEQQIDSAVKRGRAYWFADGFTEITAGILFLVLGAAVLLRGWAGRGGFLAAFPSAAADIALLKIVAFLAAVLAVWWLKDRFTYPRTGYVRGQRIPPAVLMGFIRNLLLIIVLPLLGLIAALLFIPPLRIGLAFVPAGLPMVIGALWGAFAFIAGWWMGLRRFRFLGWFIILAGIAIGVWQILSGIPELSAQIRSINFLEPLPEVLRGPLDELLIRALTSIGLLTLSSGIGLSVTGLITFLRYRKDNPVPYREEA